MASETITRNDLKAILDEVLPSTNKAFVIQQYNTADYTIAAGATGFVDITPTMAGYRPVAVAGCSTNAAGVLIQQCRFINESFTTIRLTMKNTSSASLTNHGIIQVLFQPN